MELGRDDGILSRVHPSSFRRKFKNSDLKAAVCAMCVGGSYNIVYLSDTHKPKRTIEYDYDNPLFPNMSEERVHYIYFDPMLIKNMYQISGECKPISTRLLRLLD